jgi:hypothetical protein
MKPTLIAAVAAFSLSMSGVALADPVSAKQPSVGQSQVVYPNQRAGYLAQNGVVMPNQRAQYLAGNSSVLPSQRPAYLA